MARDQRAHVERIRKDFQASQRVKDSLNNSIQALAHDLYSKETHFIFELIQNAEDNTYKKTEPSLSFRLVKADPTNTQNAVGALIIQNNEIGFSPDDVDAICAVGTTTKSKIQGYIGEKGIGFKSVFRITTMPHIYSGGYRFCLPEEDKETGLGYIVPLWLEKPPKGIDPCHTTIILPLDKPDFGYERIEEMLQDIKPETILFLSKLKEIQIITDTGDMLNILKDNFKMPLVQILIEGERQGKSLSSIDEFLLYTKTVDKPEDVNHEKRIGIDKRDVSIAFPLDENKESVGKIFAYLPVRSDTGLPFLINADFILPSSREEIRGNVPWNEWLMKCVANLIADALPRLKERDLLTVDLLEGLAKRMNELDENSMFYPIVEAVRDALMDQELLPADEGTFVSARDAKLARGAELRKLLTHDQLRELFQSKDAIRWLSGEITQDRTPDLRSYLLSDLKVEEMRPERFAQLITDYFLEAQIDDWIIQFYNFLGKDKSDLWKKPDSILRQKKILRLEDNSHVIPFQPDGNPNAFLPSSSKTKFPTIKRNIFNDKGAEEFLRNLRLFEPDLFAEVITFVLPKYIDHPSLVDFQDNIEDFKKINKLINTPFRKEAKNSIAKLRILLSKLGFESSVDKLDENSEELILPLLKMVLPQFKLFRAVNKDKGRYKSAKDIYLNNADLHMYFENNPTAWFVDKSYPEDLEQLFKELSIGDIPRAKRKHKSDKGYVIIQSSHGWHKRGLNGFDPGIEVDGLEYALKHPTVEKSSFIWNRIAIANSDCIRGIVESSSRKTFENSKKKEQISQKLGQLLMENDWLPDRQGKLHKPSELELDDLPDSFVRDEKLGDSLGMKKNIVSALAEKVGVSVDDINLIKQLKEYPDVYEKIKADILAKKKKAEFPEKALSNAERRKEKIIEKYRNSPKRKYEKKSLSKKTTENTIDPRTWLRETYTNKERQMICQICQKEMPFKKRNGEYYFEAIELLNDFDREMEELHIALCPLCAAMYNEFVKHDEGAMEFLKNTLMDLEDVEVPLQLGELDTSIRFVESHWRDIRTILQEMG